MTKTKFIPAPWTYDGNYVWLGIPGDGKMIAEIRGWGWLQHTAQKGQAEEIMDANGNLMAAAPELYTELKKLVELLDDTDIAVKNGIVLRPALNALEKAMGEKQ